MKGFYFLRQGVREMKDPFVFLCPEVTRNDAHILMEWLQDAEVRRFLSDHQSVSAAIGQVLERVGLPVVTHLFNQNGRFFMVCNKQHRRVGFVRLAVRSTETEMVIAIGRRSNWGKRLGTAAIRETLKTAFFEMRSLRVVAKIHHENLRSVHAFAAAGFRIEYETEMLKSFAITMREYLDFLRAHPVVSETIYITEIDHERLTALLSRGIPPGDARAEALDRELSRACVLEPEDLPDNVVTMNSRVLLHVDGEEEEAWLAYPQDAGRAEDALSVLSSVGTAILGYEEGDRIEWEVSSGCTVIQIEKILYQPEAAGHYHL